MRGVKKFYPGASDSIWRNLIFRRVRGRNKGKGAIGNIISFIEDALRGLFFLFDFSHIFELFGEIMTYMRKNAKKCILF